MLPPELVLEVRRLVDEGCMSQRTIARKLGVSRGTVSAIADGRRRPTPLHALTAKHASREYPSAAVRCPNCGGKVYLPCRLCRARAHRAILELKRLLEHQRLLDEPRLLDERRPEPPNPCRAA